MSIEFACTACGSQLRVPDSKAGAKGRCPHCKEVIHVPDPQEVLEADVDDEDDFWHSEEFADETPASLPPRQKAGSATSAPPRQGKRRVAVGSYQPKTALVWTITVLMGVHALMILIGIGASFYQLGLLNELAAGQNVPQEQLELSDLLVGAPACVLLLVWLATAVLWCFWKAGANRNARALSGNNLEYTPGWAVGSYFVPFANLVWPYRAMKEIFENSGTGVSTAIVGWWWGVLLVDGAINRAVTRYSMRAETLTEITNSTRMELAVAPLDLACVVVATLLVWKLHQTQQKSAGLQ